MTTKSPSVGNERHQRAIGNTLHWAEEAAQRDAFDEALGWLRVVEVVDGALPPGWEGRQAAWRRQATTGDHQ